ncbi:hypothetical protein [Enterococcus sp. 5H]|uniref:hypothetical protein n=1 Tax=Enterococcus sp. 5H TaxID=1229490 RepID=UPI002302ECF7|nr:hypothetical protein [Enterococcus sp. 5H]MDA9471947.1 hypothetical protein [Enterococcus sp. 5H]
MDITKKQNEIEKTEYQDMAILDVQTYNFGDELSIFVENSEEKCWEISFQSCYKVSYETDANWRGIDNVRDMRGGQLGYYGQDITLHEYNEDDAFIQCKVDLSIMTLNIVCKNIFVREILLSEKSFL